MTQLVLILVLACTLLLLVTFLLRDAFGSRSKRGGAIRTPVAPLLAETPSRALMDRIFAEDDLSFIAGEKAKEIRRQFLHDRRKLALSWLLRTRRQATGILRSHLHTVGALELQPAVEVKLLSHVLMFFAVYAMLRVLVTFYGAFWARSLMKNMVALAGRLSGLGGSILADTGRMGLEAVQS